MSSFLEKNTSAQSKLAMNESKNTTLFQIVKNPSVILKDLHTGEQLIYDSATKLYKSKDNKMQVKVVTNLDTNQIQLTPKLF